MTNNFAMPFGTKFILPCRPMVGCPLRTSIRFSCSQNSASNPYVVNWINTTSCPQFFSVKLSVVYYDAEIQAAAACDIHTTIECSMLRRCDETRDTRRSIVKLPHRIEKINS